jgi:hypothetical protein
MDAPLAPTVLMSLRRAEGAFVTTPQMTEFFQAMATPALEKIWKDNDRSQWSDDAFLTVSQILKARGVWVGRQETAREADIAEATKAPPFSFGRLWRGEMSLGETFWAFYVAVRVAILVVAVLAGVAAKLAGVTDITVLIVFAAIAGPALLVATPVLMTTVWRAAENYTGDEFLAKRAKRTVWGEIALWGAAAVFVALAVTGQV